MLIDTTAFLRPASSPALDAPAQQPAVAPHDDDAALAAQFTTAWQQAFTLADEQAPALAANLQGLSRTSPEALLLYLQNVTAQSRRELTAANAQVSSAINTDAMRPNSQGLLKNFGEVLDKANARNVSQNQAYLGKYSRYMVALSELMAKINSHVKAETGKDNEGKSDLNGFEIFKSLMDFRNDWAGDKGIVQSFTDHSSAAEAAKNRFRSGTVEVKEENGKFNLRFAIGQFRPIISAIAQAGKYIRNGQFVDLSQPQAVDEMMRILSEGGDPKSVFLLTKGRGMNAHSVQSLTLALNDVQKTHQTDLDLLLNDFSRSVSQFDNLVKLYSSLATALTETCKSFL